MQEVKVSKDSLMAIVQANRDKHQETFEQAQTIYRKMVIEELDRMLEEAKQGKKIRRFIQLPEPENHTKDYERVLAMLAMEVEDTVVLAAHEFENYVQDEWNWNMTFAANTLRYTTGNPE